jgi:hypothetical protein
MSKKKGDAAVQDVMVYEDVYMRAKKFAEVKPVAQKPKGDITLEDLSLPIPFQQLPEIRPAVQYWQNACTVKYQQRGLLAWPTNAKEEASSENEEQRRPKKEIQDFIKVMKSIVKQAEKVKNACFKQYEKSETKNEKRQGIQEKIKDIETEINDDLRRADTYAKKRKLFATKYVYGSKLGQTCQDQNVAVVAEVSDRMSEWMEEAKEDVSKFFNVFEKNSVTFNMFLLGESIVPYKQGYQQTQSKTGAADCQKWFAKNFTPKTASGSPWPPDWVGLMHTLCGDESLPTSIHIVCSKAPSTLQRVSTYLSEVREQHRREIPITIVSFDPDVDKDANQRSLFKDLVGERGEVLVDTTKIDMDYVDKILIGVKSKKKQLEKLQKQLDKIEDVSAALATNRKILQVQCSLEALVRNDLELLEGGMKKPAPDLNAVVPPPAK